MHTTTTSYPTRLRLSRTEVGEVMKHGVRAHGALCSYVWKKRTEGRALSVVVSKKVSKTAVGRNRLKRQMRAAFWAQHFTSPTPVACVIFAKSSARGAGVAALREEFAQKLTRAV